jgi:uncharacterized protein (DUF1330 family)
MTAYWVNTVRELKDADKLARYAELATPAIAAHGGRFIARGLPEAAFEEGTLDRTAIIEFPSVEAAVAAYESEAYQAALAALDGGAVRDIRIIPAA